MRSNKKPFLMRLFSALSMELKQVIVVRDDLKLPAGKLAAQVGHAAVEGVFASPKQLVSKWRAQGMKKVVVKVSSKDALLAIVKSAEEKGIVTATITDAGLTVVKPGTMTCASLGPVASEKVDTITGELPAL